MVYQINYEEDSIEEIAEVYNYISKKAPMSAYRLRENIIEYVMKLSDSPRLFAKIDKVDRLKREYRRIIIKNYVILYTIDEVNKTIYISHMYYKRKNYL